MSIANYLPNVRAWLRNRRTRKIDRDTVTAISALPPHVLKDIGWPAAWERQRHSMREYY